MRALRAVWTVTAPRNGWEWATRAAVVAGVVFASVEQDWLRATAWLVALLFHVSVTVSEHNAEGWERIAKDAMAMNENLVQSYVDVLDSNDRLLALATDLATEQEAPRG